MFVRRVREFFRSGFARLGRTSGRVAATPGSLPEQPDLLSARVDAVPDEFGQAFALHQQGRLDEALAGYRALLQRQPEHPDALHFLGVLQAQHKQFAEAEKLIRRAVEINPENATAHLNHGRVFRALKRHEESLTSYDRVLTLEPENLEALLNRGAALVDLGRRDAALTSYDAVLALKPDHREAQVKRCRVLSATGRHHEALAGYDRVLEKSPDDHDAWFNRGLVLAALTQYAEALSSYDRALALSPESADVLNNRGVVLARLGRETEALSSYERAIAVNAGNADAHNNRGALLADLGRHEEALASYERALSIAPDFPGFLNNRAGLLRLMGEHARAAQDYSRLLELDPEFDQALGHKLFANIQICDWRNFSADRRQLEQQVRDGKRVLPFSFLVLTDSGAEQLKCARTYAAQKYPPRAPPLWQGERYRHDRIRVAYLSADYYLHATSHLMVELFEQHDRQRFEVSAWSFGPDVKDDMRARLEQAFEHFIDVRSMNDDAVADLLRAREIDIAVDLKGYSKWSRPGIFARRAVPVQVNYLVYPGTTGADHMDYIIGDADVIPLGHEEYYSEKIVRMPDSYQVNGAARRIAEETPLRAEAGLPDAGFVFCCFNNNYKITPDVFDVWMRLLKRVDGSVLWLLEGNVAASGNLMREAEARGVRRDRLVFAKRLPPADHLARHRLADLFLDTLPCNAHTTASDALWAGLPLLTCRGNAFAGRVAAGLLRAMGVPELIADNLADYEAMAFKLATTPEMVARLKSRLEKNRTTYPLFDIDLYRRHIESAYGAMYERYQQGEAPKSFSVPRLP